MNSVNTSPGTSVGISASAGTVAGRLADWACHLAYEAIPAEAVESAKLLLLDQIGLASGAALRNVQPELQMVAAMRAAPESTIVGTRLRTTAAYAAFANGTTAGSSEFDDALWDHLHIADTAFRPYPTIGSAATVLEGLTALTREHPGLD